MINKRRCFETIEKGTYILSEQTITDIENVLVAFDDLTLNITSADAIEIMQRYAHYRERSIVPSSFSQWYDTNKHVLKTEVFGDQ